jgi:hypothetical protein
MGAPHKKLNRDRHEALPRARFQGILGYTAEFGERTAIKLAEEEGFEKPPRIDSMYLIEDMLR